METKTRKTERAERAFFHPAQSKSTNGLVSSASNAAPAFMDGKGSTAWYSCLCLSTRSLFAAVKPHTFGFKKGMMTFIHSFLSLLPNS